MTVRISPLNLSLPEEESALQEKAAEILQVSLNDLRDFRIIKKSLDARRKNRIHFVYAVELSLPPEREQSLLRQPPPALQVEEVPPKTVQSPPILKSKPHHRPLIVGTGPAGLFAAWKLTQNGLPPLILERGREVSARVKDVNRFWKRESWKMRATCNSARGERGLFPTESSLPVSTTPASLKSWRPLSALGPLRKSNISSGPTSERTVSAGWWRPCGGFFRNRERSSASRQSFRA